MIKGVGFLKIVSDTIFHQDVGNVKYNINQTFRYKKKTLNLSTINTVLFPLEIMYKFTVIFGTSFMYCRLICLLCRTSCTGYVIFNTSWFTLYHNIKLLFTQSCKERLILCLRNCAV